MKFSTADIAQITAGTLHGAGNMVVSGVSTDTRSLRPGALFAAFSGAQIDSHELLGKAQSAGATAALVSRHVLECDIVQIQVADVLLALGQLAKAWRSKVTAKRIAITGSNGKTTVKNLTRSILEQCGATWATPGNLNNELGLPLSILGIEAQHQFAVLEMGAGKPGDIAYLAEVGAPQISLVNNAMAAHLERLGSVQGVAVEKSAIYRGLVPNGIAVVNLDDAELPTFRAAAHAANAEILGFSLNNSALVEADSKQLRAAVFASDVHLGSCSEFILHCPLGECQIKLSLVGLHNVRNALAAATLAFAAGASLLAIERGLNQAQAASGRLRLLKQPGGWNVLDDSYNANPGSLKAGIDALVVLPGKPWVVLGNMAELGAEANAMHAEIGEHARAVGVQRLYCVGTLAADAARAAGPIASHFDSLEDLVERLKSELAPGVNLLVKGSRSAKMERVFSMLGATLNHSSEQGSTH